MRQKMLSILKASPLGNNRGSMIILTAVALVAMFAFAALTIDGAEMMTTRNQLQAAADAAALAGASGLMPPGGSKDSAINRAIAIAANNQAEQDVKRPVNITAADITFPNPGQIRVRTHRTAGTGDALVAYFLRIVNPSSNNLTDVTATATAEVYDVCSSDCLKPWSIPDRWDDVNGNGKLDPGENYDPITTGYQAPGDVGMSAVLKMGSPSGTIAPGQYFPIDLPPLNCNCGVNPQTGGDQYRWNIGNCNQYIVGPGDQLQLEPGNKVGPTSQGVQQLIDQDPGAYWDASTNTVMGSSYGKSPRVILVPFFDPTSPPTSGRNYVTVTKIGAFFIEGVRGNGDVTGRFISASVDGPKCTVQNPGTFIHGLALIQ
jgi:Flp pilus assembly protein TadG